MRFTRTGTAAALTLGALTLGALAPACTSSGSHGPATTTAPVTTAVGSSTSSATPSTPVPPAATTSTSAPAGSATSLAGVAICVASGMKGTYSIIPGSGAAGHVEARVVLTNTSAARCRTFGYVGMQLLGAGGSALPTNVVRDPGTITTIVLEPGDSASAVSRFSPNIPGQGDSTSGTCQPVAQNTEITPPNDTHQLVAPGPGSSVCERGTIDLRPLQAGATAGP